MSIRISLAVATLAAASAFAVAPDIDNHARPFIDSKRVVALSVGVIKDGKSIDRHFGQLSIEDKTKPDIDTFYEIGSVTKVFTTTLLSDMVKRGQVKLDQPVEQLLDDRFEIPQFKKRKITLRDLATHQSALPRMPHNFAPKDPKNPYATYSELRLIVGLAETKLKRSPGEKYAYSNLGMGLLGHALSKKAGKPYEQLIIDRIAKPLGMKDTKITFAKADRPRIATGYDAAHNEWPNWDLNSLSAAGAIRSTVRDMLRFVDANLKLDTKAPINDAMKLTQTRQAGTGMGSIALGWHIARDGTTYWHNGQTGGYHSYIAFNRKFNIGVVVFAQIGRTQWRPRHIAWTRSMDPDAFREKFRAARIVVAHAGMGTIIKARESGKPIIVMPRRADVGEHRNDHQLATARQLRELGAVSVAFDEQELIGQLENLDRIKASAAIDAHASNRLIHTLSNFIQTGSMAA